MRSLPPWLALGLTLAAYLPRLSAPLVWDDRHWIVFNPALDRPIALSSYFKPEYFGLSFESTWRPLATFSYAVMSRASGKSPALMRGFSLALHLSNAALLWAVLKRAGAAPAVAALAASLLLVHPAHAETLMCVSFSKELLSALGLLAMLCLHQRSRSGAAALAYAAACLSKEPGILGLPIVVVYDRIAEGRNRWRAYAPYAAVAAVYLLLRFGPLAGPGGEANLSQALPLGERLYYGAQGFAAAWRIFFLPVRPRLEYFALPGSSLEAAGWLAGAAVCAAATLGLARKSREARFFLIWPLFFLALTSNILPTGVLSTRYLAERWLYHPYIGASVAAAFGLAKAPRLAAAAVCALGALTIRQAVVWSDEVRLWRQTAEVYPWSSKAREGLGEALFRAGLPSEALAEFQEALRVRQAREDKVLAHYVPIAPPGTVAWESASLYRWLGHSYYALGRAEEAAAMLEKALALDPKDGFAYRLLAYSSARAGKFEQARRWVDAGLARDPGDDFLRRLKGDVAAGHLTFEARFD